MKDAGAQFVFQRLDGRKALQCLRRLVELGGNGIEVRAADAGDCVLKQITKRRVAP